MLENRVQNFEGLTAVEAAVVATALELKGVKKFKRPTTVTGASLYQACAKAGLSEADIIEAVAASPAAQARKAMEKLTGKKVKQAKPKATKAKTGTKPKQEQQTAQAQPYRGKVDPRILVEVVSPNPKREGCKSWKRFQNYLVGKPLTESFMNPDVPKEERPTPADVKWDLERGYIKLTDPS